MNKKILIWIIGIIFLATAVQSINTTGNVMYYSIDNSDRNGNDIFDLSGNGHNGTNSGGTLGVSGIILQGIDLDGSSDYLTSDNPLISGNTFSINTWIKPDSDTSFMIADNHLGGSDGIIFRYDSGQYSFIKAGGATLGYTTSAPTTWTMVTATANTTGMYFYINGTLKNNNTDTANMGAPGNNMWFGRQHATGRELNGEMDEISIWNRSITPTEITELYNSGIGLNPYTPAGEVTNINITTYDLWTQTTLSGFGTTIKWPNGTQEYKTGTTFSQYLNVSNYNITINLTLNKTGFNTRTINNIAITANTTTNLNYSLQNSSTNNIKIYAMNFANSTQLASAKITDNYLGNTQNTNPYQTDISNYVNVNKTSQSINLNIQDLQNYHINYTGNITITTGQTEYYVQLTPNKLALYFNQNGVAHNTKGFVEDLNNTYNFTDTSLVIVQQNLTLGRVRIAFNNLTNWTQYYEYENTWETYINDTLEVLEVADWFSYFQVVDAGGSPIEGVTIDGYFAIPYILNGSITPKKLYSKRMTDDAGLTFFWIDSRATSTYRFSKTGYQDVEILPLVVDESYTKDDPLVIQMFQAGDTTVEGDWMLIQNTYWNETLNIGMAITTKRKSPTIKTNTQYGINNGIANSTLTLDTNTMRYIQTFESGVHFSQLTPVDINVLVWIDDTLTWNKTIEYKGNMTNIMSGNEFTGASAKIINPIMWIMLIIIASGAGILFKNDGIGASIFKYGSLGIALIAPAFIFVSLIFMIGFGLSQMQKVVGE